MGTWEQMFAVPLNLGERGTCSRSPNDFMEMWEQMFVVPLNLGELFTNIGEHVHQLTGFKVSAVNN